MKKNFFKNRRFLDFSPHPYEIGNLFGSWHKYEDNHFLLKIYSLCEQCQPEYYKYHLTYTLENNIASEEEFFYQVWQIVLNRIKHYEKQNPFSRSHAIHKRSIKKLQQFQKYLNSIDQWNARPSHIVIAENDVLIQKQKDEIEKLTEQLAELKKYEVSQKISIEDNALPTLADLLIQMSNLTLPSGRKFLRCDNKSPYSKLISKYFSQDGKDIPMETSRNYFTGKKDEVTSKGTAVKEKHQFFEITPIKQAEK